MRVLALSSLLLCSALLTSTAVAQPQTFQRDDRPSAIRARGIAVADFNRDGWIDIVTAHHDPDGISVLTNRGPSGYAATFIDLPGGPFDVVTGDLNEDGLPDIAVANADANAINVLYGRAEGGFGLRADITGVANPRSLTIADVDEDGSLDIVVTEFANARVKVFWGDGRQSFVHRAPGSLTTGSTPQGVAVADFDLDGRPDIVSASSGSGGLAIHFQTAANIFTRRDLAVPPQQNVVTVGDFDRDGRPDIAAASTNSSDITVVLNQRSGMSTAVYPSGGGSPRGIVAADLNRDGALDLITGNRATSTMQVLLGAGDGRFAGAQGYAAGSGSRAVTAGDFDNDGRVDLASANEFATTMTVLSNRTAFPRGAFAFSRQEIGSNDSGFSDTHVAVADFDVDGKLDVATSGNGVVVHLANGRTTRIAAEGIGDLAAAKANGDAFPDLLVVQTGSNPADRSRIEVYLGDGAGNFPGRRTTQTSLVAREVRTADLNRDGHVDLVVFGSSDTAGFVIQALLGDGDGRFTVVSTMPLERTNTSPSVGDIDRDGDPDVVAYINGLQSGVTRVVWWLNDGTGRFAAPRAIPVDEFDGIYGGDLGDVNHDGYLDFAAAGYPRVYSTQRRVAVLLGGPNGFAQASYLSTGEFVQDVMIADLSLDGHPDVLGSTGALFVGNGDGTFDSPELFDLYAPDGLIVDFNGDGLPDVVGAWKTSSAIVFLNERRDTNRAPTVDLGQDFTIQYRAQFGDGEFELWARPIDPDLHKPTFKWRLPDGTEVDTGTFPFLTPPHLKPGRHEFFVEARDGRGGVATDSVVITVLPEKEIVLHVGDTWYADPRGSWHVQDDVTAASGKALHDTNAGLPKVTTPRANPANYADVGFIADPTQTYKLWVRLKADGNSWANDSLWLQFSGAVDASGRAFAPGTASGIEVNLEECSGCGLSGWGWRDEAWGRRDAIGTLTLRFPDGGWQNLRIQTREDGVSIDQLVLSSEKYRTARPGATKNDATIVPRIFY